MTDSLGKKIAISLVSTLFVFAINFLIPSQTNGFHQGINSSLRAVWDNPHAGEVFTIRYNHSEFGRRPVVLEFQQLMKKRFDLPYQFSFNLINYLSLFLFFAFLPKLSNVVNQERYEGISLQLFILFALPILFAYFPTINTYDDTVQYLFLTLFLIYLFEHRQLPAMIAFLLACISRETSLIYLAVIGGYLYLEGNFRIGKVALWIIPLMLYTIFLAWYVNPELLQDSKSFLVERRFYAWQQNFADFRTFRESTTILCLMLAFPLLLLRKKIKRDDIDNRSRRWEKLAVFFLLANAVLVSCSGLIREARLLFIPLLLAAPLIHTEIKAGCILIKKEWRQLTVRHYLLIIGWSALIAFGWYAPKTVGTGYLFKAYAFGYCSLLLGIIVLNRKASGR